MARDGSLICLLIVVYSVLCCWITLFLLPDIYLEVGEFVFFKKPNCMPVEGFILFCFVEAGAAIAGVDSAAEYALVIALG